jgi:hypothetical protein
MALLAFLHRLVEPGVSSAYSPSLLDRGGWSWLRLAPASHGH